MKYILLFFICLLNINNSFTEQCGICLKEGADRFWTNLISRGAHNYCLQEIEPFEKKFEDISEQIRLKGLCPNNFIATIHAHKAMISAIQKFCHLDLNLSILNFLELYGDKETLLLFNTFGKDAFIDYYYINHEILIDSSSF